MSFEQNIFSTLIGTFAGFLFAIALFYLQNKWSLALQKRNLKKNLKKEFEFNLKFLEKTLDDVNKIIERITTNNKKVYTFLKYTNLQRIFLQIYFQQGYLYDALSPEEIQLLDEILLHFDKPYQDYINIQIEGWRTGTINQADMIDVFAFERDNVIKYIDAVKDISKKIEIADKWIYAP